MRHFSDEHQNDAKSIHKKLFQMKQNMIPLSMHRTVSNETALASEIRNMINNENVNTAPGQGNYERIL